MPNYAATPQSSWVSASQYAEAIQCPPVCFSSPILRECEPAFDRMGLPLVTSGQFAYVFKLRYAPTGETFAVRCFQQPLEEREERYRAISEHLKNHAVTALSKFDFDPQGIKINGRKFPLLVMPYLEGQTLDVYLAQVLNRSDVIAHLADEWTKTVRALREAKVAHGDLQHGNVIVENGRLHLVDLDGTFVPALRGRKAVEIGHQHFQHPRRAPENFDENLDNFSALAIYVTLLALRERPDLWREYHDENLLFTKDDFLNPQRSALFAKVKSIGGETEKFAAMLEQAALGPNPLNAPDFTQFVAVQSRLPAWMTAPLDVKIEKRTREATKIDVPIGVKVSDKIRTPTPAPISKVPVPVSVPSSYQTIFNSPSTLSSTAGRQNVAGRKYNRPITFAELLPATWESAIYWIKDANVKKAIGASAGASFWIITLLVKIFGVYSLIILLTVIALWLFIAFIEALEHLELNSSVSAALPSYTNRAVPTQVQTAPVNLLASITHRVYHSDQCDLAGIIPIKDRSYFASETQARKSGYRPCHICLQPHASSNRSALPAKQIAAFIGSRSSHIFHDKKCYLVDTIAYVNREFFASLIEAQQAGYRPCKICKP